MDRALARQANSSPRGDRDEGPQDPKARERSGEWEINRKRGSNRNSEKHQTEQREKCSLDCGVSSSVIQRQN